MIINGKQISHEILGRLEKEIRQKNLKLRLAAVLIRPVRGPTRLKGVVGRRPLFERRFTSDGTGIKKFLELKGKAARKIGVDYDIFEFPETITEDRLKKEVRKMVQDERNDGVLVELPLPKGINAQNILNEISAEKDVDVLSQEAQDLFYEVELSMEIRLLILPPAVEAVKTILDFYHVGVKNKKAVVFGYGLLVGKPVAHWLKQNGAAVSVVDENTKNPRKNPLEADIIISGVGKPELIGGDMVKKGVAAIDFGYQNKDGRITGDFRFDEVAPKASLITPVPGGVGPIVVAAVLGNLLKLNP